MRHNISEQVARAIRIAAVLTLFAIAMPGCGPDSNDVSLRALVQTSLGQVEIDGKAARKGDALKIGQEIKVGPDSLCDLLIKSRSSVIKVRLSANTSYSLTSFQAGDKHTIQGRLRSGEGFFHPRLNHGENFRIKTPTAIASVRGTKFSAQVHDDGSSSTSVYEGKVSHRPHMEELEDLHPEVFEKSQVLKEVIKTLEDTEHSLEAGQSMKTVQNVSNPELKKILAHPDIQKLKGKKTASRAELEAAASVLDKQFDKPGHVEKLKGHIKDTHKKTRQSPTKIKPEVLKSRLERHESSAHEAVKKDKEADRKKKDEEKAKPQTFSQRVQQYNKLIEEQGKGKVSLTRISKVLGKKYETIKLKGGKSLKGVIYQSGKKYYVYTSKGKVTVLESQLAEIRF